MKKSNNIIDLTKYLPGNKDILQKINVPAWDLIEELPEDQKLEFALTVFSDLVEKIKQLEDSKRS